MPRSDKSRMLSTFPAKEALVHHYRVKLARRHDVCVGGKRQRRCSSIGGGRQRRWWAAAPVLGRGVDGRSQRWWEAAA